MQNGEDDGIGIVQTEIDCERKPANEGAAEGAVRNGVAQRARFNALKDGADLLHKRGAETRLARLIPTRRIPDVLCGFRPDAERHLSNVRRISILTSCQGRAASGSFRCESKRASSSSRCQSGTSSPSDASLRDAQTSSIRRRRSSMGSSRSFAIVALSFILGRMSLALRTVKWARSF